MMGPGGKSLARRVLLVLALAVCACTMPPPGSSGRPQQIHLSWEKDSTRLVSVMWVTWTVSPQSRVRSGRTPSLELESVDADTMPGPRGSGLYLHHALLGPLVDQTRYYYAVGDDTSGWSSRQQFTTAPPTGVPVTFVAAADMGQGELAQANALRMAGANPAFVLHLGDLSYASKPDDWDAWFRLIEPVASMAPYMTAIGNHEYESLTGLSTYLRRLALPDNERRYSFNCGLLHVVILESGQEYGTPSAEDTAWLQSDLERNSKDPMHPWTVVGLHFPPFNSGRYGSWQEGRAAWSPLFDRYRVALVLSGHMHGYERTWPVDSNGKVAGRDYRDPKAPVYVVTGGSGAHRLLYSYGDPAPDWSAFRAAQNETLRVTVDRGSLTVVAIHPDGSELDSFTITRELLAPAPPTQPGTPFPAHEGDRN